MYPGVPWWVCSREACSTLYTMVGREGGIYTRLYTPGRLAEAIYQVIHTQEAREASQDLKEAFRTLGG